MRFRVQNLAQERGETRFPEFAVLGFGPKARSSSTRGICKYSLAFLAAYFLFKRPLQEFPKLLREFGAKTVDSLNILHRSLSQTVQGTKVFHKISSPDLSESWKFVQDGFLNFLGAEVGVKGIGKTVSLIPDALQEFYAR